ncbi:hypothetical protein LCGC14_2413410, partial [marine sediment metagenome]
MEEMNRTAGEKLAEAEREHIEDLRRIGRAWGFVSPVDDGWFDTVEQHEAYIIEHCKLEIEENDILIAKLDRLAEALRKYGTHLSTCKIRERDSYGDPLDPTCT